MKHCDFVIVGAGSAGCVLAERLSAEGHAVLVLEAGGTDDDVLVQAPLLFAGLFQGPKDWNYDSEPEPGLHGRRVYLPRGKMLGGSSSMNAMFYIRGTREDYDGWAREHGATGWSYDEVLPYFKRSENNADIQDHFHGTEGPLRVTTQRWLSGHADAFIATAVDAGIEHNPDFNGATQAGVGLMQVNGHDGKRCSTADAFLRPAMTRGNVEVLTGATVHRVVLDGNRAVGVEFEHQGHVQTAVANAEVVLSAGAYNSPKLLMLSGIGPAAHLTEHGIPVAVDLPAVGANLQDHPFTLLHWTTSKPNTLADLADPRHMEQWTTDHTGMVTSNAGEAAIMWRSDPGLASPDFQIIFVPGWFWEHGFRQPATPGMSIGMSYNGPSSRGSVRLRSADPAAPPRIVSNLLGSQTELDAVIRAFDFVDELASRRPLADLFDEQVNPGPGVDRSLIEPWIRAETQHMYHAACSVRIGAPGEGAVDAQLRVHGVEGLRVIDASVMPRITSGNTHAPTIMIGERGADLLLGRTTAEPTDALAATS
jgi:choline dehydrogenase-like flavoprotein